MKIIRIVILLALIVITSGVAGKSFSDLSIEKFGRDFVGYWSAGHLLLKGENPYSYEKILKVHQSIGWTEKEPIIIYNPPWVITFIIPFSMSSFATDRIMWLICSLSFMLFSADRLWLLYGGSRETRIWAMIVTATFCPVLVAFKLGQIALWTIFGLAGFLHFIKTEKWWFAGMMTVFIAVKPHSIFLFWFALLFWSLKHHKWQVMFGSGITLVFVSLIPLFFNPNIMNQYYNNIVITSSALLWATPTLGTFLRLFLGSEHSWLQYIPTLFGMIWFIFRWNRYKNVWIWEHQLPILIFASLITNFYIWPPDYLMILPGIIQAGVWIFQNPGIRYLRGIFLLYTLINVGGFISAYIVLYHWYIWMPYAFLLNYILVNIQVVPSSKEAVESHLIRV